MKMGEAAGEATDGGGKLSHAGGAIKECIDLEYWFGLLACWLKINECIGILLVK